MPPYSELVNGGGNDVDGDGTGLERKNRATDLGFTAPLIESISSFKSKIETWVEHEKSTTDARAQSYNNQLVQQQALIDSQVVELASVQRDRGMHDATLEGEEENDDNRENHAENIATRKKALEDESTKIQVEIMKLKLERDNREKRVNDIALEESKQRLRASDAAALKRRAEESKNTTIDDLTRGVVNYKKLGLDFEQTGDGELEFKFDQLDPNDPSRFFSFKLFINDEDNYDISGCDPNINSVELAEILDETNASSDRENMSTLARCMRRAFKDVCEREHQ
mmetsp:Transcript_26062/g.57106  ORF Transcript_26062/g.57106 Transcript_26062/m.57106 type:complete len:283 (+) Transcript_26062:124-972(+)